MLTLVPFRTQKGSPVFINPEKVAAVYATAADAFTLIELSGASETVVVHGDVSTVMEKLGARVGLGRED